MRNEQFRAKQALGRVGLEKGRVAELKALEAINQFAIHEPWFKSARMSTKREDARGIDLIVETHDMGALYLQVKSSNRRAIKYMEEHRGMVVAVIVVPYYEKIESIWGKILPKILELRNEIAKRRSGS